MNELVLPTVEELQKKTIEGKGKAHGISPWENRLNQPYNVQGAILKKGRWQDYYDMYRTHAIVRAAIDKIAKTSTNSGFDFVPRDSRRTILESEVVTLQDFFSGQPDFLYELRRIYKDLMIYGDAYLYIVPDRRRKPVKLKRLSPQTIHIKVSKNGEVLNYYQKDLDDITDEVTVFQPHEILHFRIDDPDNDVYGLAPLASLVLAVTADLYAQKYNAAFFMNSGVTGTIISIKNADPGEIQRNREWLTKNYTGAQNAHKPLVLEGESVSVEKAVATHNEMGFLEGRKFIILEILAVLDVPPVKVGITDTANRSTAKEEDKTFRGEAISPLQNIVQSVINDYFIRDILGVKETIFIHSEADTRDAIEQMDYYTKGQAWGNFNVNEVRAKLGMAPVDGGDINGIMSPTGFVPVDRLRAYFQPLEIPKGAVDTPQDPLKGEAPPKRRKTVATGSSPALNKSIDPSLFLKAGVIKIQEALTRVEALPQAYTYIYDVSTFSSDTRVQHALESIEKAMAAPNDMLRKGYTERAAESFGSFVQTLDNDFLEYINEQ